MAPKADQLLPIPPALIMWLEPTVPKASLEGSGGLARGLAAVPILTLGWSPRSLALTQPESH